MPFLEIAKKNLGWNDVKDAVHVEPSGLSAAERTGVHVAQMDRVILETFASMNGLHANCIEGSRLRRQLSLRIGFPDALSKPLSHEKPGQARLFDLAIAVANRVGELPESDSNHPSANGA